MSVSFDLNWSHFQRLSNKVPPLALQAKSVCPFCQIEEGFELLCLKDIQCFEDREGQNRFTHRIIFCESCGMIYTDPWFTREGARWLMERAGASYGHCDPAERVDWVLSRIPEIRSALDLGCGDGSFLGAFPKSLVLSGVETDEQMILSGRLKFPHVKLLHDDLQNPGDLPTADLITLFHILEHLSDPLDFLVRLKQRMGPSSRLLVEVPILDRAIETHGPDICGFFSIPHRSHFSRNTLERMLAEAGWFIEHRCDLEGNGYRVLASSKKLEEIKAIQVDPGSEKKLALDYIEIRESSVNRVQKIIDQLPEEGDFIIWGAGHHTEFLERLTSLFSRKRRFLIVDKDPVKSGAFLHGIPIMKPTEIPPEYWGSQGFSVIISSYCWQESILKDLAFLGVLRPRIIKLYP